MTEYCNPSGYSYDALPPGEYARYMILYPGSKDEPLQCTLRTASLDQMPEFEAISYVWGKPIKAYVVLCDGQNILVTENLRNALRQVRLESEARILWADSICIHQADANERAHQVVLMGQIYSRSKNTLICLGEDDSEQAEHVASLMLEVKTRIKELPRKARYNQDNFPYVHRTHPLLMTHPGWKAIETLLQNPWFHRLWVVQEAALASVVTLHWGTCRIDWVSFLLTVCYADALAHSILEAWSVWLPDLHNLRLIAVHSSLPKAIRGPMKSFKFKMIDMMRQGRALGTSDQRDRIYAVLGLASLFFGSQFNIVPNYTLPVTQVFQQFAERYVETTKDLDILNCVQHDDQFLTASNPSWVPNWSASSGLVWSIRDHRPLRSKSNETFEPVILRNGALKLRGVLLDRIQSVSEPLRGGANQMKLQAARAWNDVNHSGTRLAYSTDTRHLAFAWTIKGGKRTGTSPEEQRRAEAQYLYELHREGAEFEGNLFGDIESWAQLDPSSKFGKKVEKVARDRCLITTDRGYFGLGPRVAQKNDICCLIFGARSPFVLRATETEGSYKLVGEIYITAEVLAAERSSKAGHEDGFTLLGKARSMDWTSWGLGEQDIIIC